MNFQDKVKNFLYSKAQAAKNFFEQPQPVQQTPISGFRNILNQGAQAVTNFINQAPSAIGTAGMKNLTFQPGTSAYQMAQPVRDLAPLVSSFPMYQPLKRSAETIKEYVAPKGGYTNNDTSKLINAAKAAPSFVLNAYGSAFPNPAVLATSAGFGAVTNPRNPVQGAFNALESAPAISSVGAMTNPIIDKVGFSIGSKFASPISSFAARGATRGLAQIPEGIAMKGAISSQPYDLADAGWDFASGFIPGSGGSAKGKGFNNAKPGMNETDIKQVAEVYRRVKELGYKTAEGKVDLDTFGKDRDYIEEVFKDYIGKRKEDLQKPFEEKLNMLFDQARYDFRRRTPAMNLTDGKLNPEQQQASKKLPGILYSTDKKVAEGGGIGIPLKKQPDQILKNAYKEIGDKQPVKNTIKDFANQFYTDWVDRFHPVTKLVDEVTNKGKIELKSDANPIYKIKRLMGAGGIAELRHKQELDPIVKQLGNIPKNDFDVFMKAQRDIELAGRGIKGSDATIAQERIDALSSKYDIKKLQAVADQLYTYQSKGLAKLKESGFLSDEAVKNISDLNQKYVPFQRVQDEIDNFLGVPTNKLQQASTPIKKIKGSDKAILSPLESVIANTYKIEAAVAKNEVAKSIVKLDSVNPVYKGLFTKVKEAGNDTMTIWENGKKSYYSAPNDIIKVVKGLNEEGMSTLTKILSAPASFFRQQTTGRNVAFFVPNVVRDQFDAAINAKYGYIPFFDYLDGIGHLIKDKYGGGDPLVKQWYESGGSIFFENMGGRKEIREQIKDATQQKHIAEKVLKWASTGIDTLSDFSEKPTRLGVFKRALKATGDANIATYESREATLDFARMGAKMKVANSLIPFLNVQVQGFDKMIRSAKENPAKTGLMLAAYGMLPQTMISLYNNYFHGQDYAQVPDFVKEDSFVIMTDKKDRDGKAVYITIPKGHVPKLVATPTDNFITWLAGNNPQDFQQMALSLLTGSLPVVGQGDNLSDITSRTVGNVLPQFAKPAVEATLNQDTFRNRSIVDPYLSKEPPAAQFYQSTPQAYRDFGSKFNVSPAKVQHIVEGYAGGNLKEANRFMSTVQDVAAGNPLDPNSIPLARRFVGSYSGFDTERPSQDEPVDVKQRVLDREAKLKLKNSNQDTLQANGKLYVKRKDGSVVSKDLGTNQTDDKSVQKQGFFDGLGLKKADPYVSKEKQQEVGLPSSVYRNRLEASGKTYLEAEPSRYFIRKGKSISEIDLSKPIDAPKLSGSSDIDKELIKDYKTAISSRINSIVNLYKVGAMSQEEAQKKINELKGKTGGSKKKKKSLGSIEFKLPKLKTKRITLKSPTVKPPKLPELRSNLKPLKYKGKSFKLKRPNL